MPLPSSGFWHELVSLPKELAPHKYPTLGRSNPCRILISISISPANPITLYRRSQHHSMMIPFRHNTHILLVDDDQTLNELLADILELEGARVTVANSGNHAWDLLQQELPDIVVCDVMMDNGNGFELLRRVRVQPRTTHLPFIFLTAKTEPSDFRMGMDLGADDFLTKPISKSALIKAIQLRLSRAGTLQAPNSVSFAKKGRGALLAEQLRKELGRLHQAVLHMEENAGSPPAIRARLHSLLESHGRLSITTQALEDWFDNEGRP